MNRINTTRAARRTWRAFSPREGRQIEQELRAGRAPRCPCCEEILESRAESRLSGKLPLDATGQDLDCRDCRRFWCIVRHTARSLQLVRMRRLVAAVRAVEVESRRARSREEPLTPMAV